ncbi:MAG: glycosyltransferase family 4 protein [Phycisphaerales bacterium]|nr:glycosyltransferase family 4 protein [Phycisphaerales bacterium]
MSVKVALVQRVLSPYRVPVFERFGDLPGIQLRVFYGKDIKGTKVKSAKKAGRLDTRVLSTITLQARSTGRAVPLILHPALLFRMLAFGPRVILAEGNSNVLNNIPLFLYAKLFRRKIVWWSLGQLPGREYRGLSAIYIRLVRFLEKRADAWLGYSNRAVNHFRSLGFPEDRIFRAVNCIDTDRVFDEIASVGDAAAALREKLNLNGRYVVLFVGALEPTKRLDRLFRAFAKLRQTVPNAFLAIVGAGHARDELDSLARALHIEQDTHFAGEVREGVSAWFLLGNAFVLPGLGGLAIPQAMAHGLPIICGSADGTEEDYVRDGVTGHILTSATDDELVDEIAATLRGWATDPSRAAEMGAAARRVIEDEFNIHTFVASLRRCVEHFTGPLEADSK